MKHWTKLVCLLLYAVMVLSLAGCDTTPPETTTAPTQQTAPPPTDPPEPTAEELYTAAVEALNAEQALKVSAEVSRTVTVGSESYKKSSNQNLTYQGLGTDAMIVKAEDTSHIGKESLRSVEYYSGGTVYATVDSSKFTSEMTGEAYLERLLPLVLLDESLYGSITSEKVDSGYMIHFQEAAAPEAWAAPEYAQVTSSSASAQIDSAGKLVAYGYQVTFAQGTADIALDVQLTISRPEGIDLASEVPASTDGYVALEDPDVPRMLLESARYLQMSKSATSTLTESMTSSGLGAVINKTVNLAMHGTGLDHVSKVDYESTVVDYSVNASGDVYPYSQSEKFVDGKYSVQVNDEDPVTDSSVTGSSMYSYCGTWLIQSLPDLSYISGATVTDLDGITLLEMTCNEEYAVYMGCYVAECMTGEPDFLNDLATSYETTTSEVYLAINQDTGLPTAIGISYAGSHTIEGMAYPLTFQSDQSFVLSDHSAYEEVTGEPLPVEEPEEKATPLFYHVTGADGQEMWLLGTIHIGDSRTSYLPQEIYDAFDAADALAVECDPDRLLEQIEEDEELQNIIAQSYLYTDGTTTKDHLSPELYEEALRLLKVSGNYGSTMLLMKPSVWESSITNFYLAQGYRLTPDQGVDYQLLDRAEEAGKKVIEIESAVDQLQMLNGFSDPLQEVLLAAAVDTGMREYQAEAVELYEMWCRGEEDALREAVSDDLSDATEDDLVLYEEYNKAMSTDRNAGMLEAAKSYLESGDVIFYAVGLAHLLVEDGLVNTLRAAGYTVELVPFQ